MRHRRSAVVGQRSEHRVADQVRRKITAACRSSFKQIVSLRKYKPGKIGTGWGAIISENRIPGIDLPRLENPAAKAACRIAADSRARQRHHAARSVDDAAARGACRIAADSRVRDRH